MPRPVSSFREVLEEAQATAATLTEAALARLSERLTTPLQIERHLNRPLEEGYKVGLKPVSAELIDTVIAKDIALGQNIHAVAQALSPWMHV